MIDFVLQNLNELASLPGSVPKLRSFILDRAVRGNLTTDWRQEHPDVEPASRLLERIREEKRELVKTGKIKKQKELPAVNPEEVPFTVPEGWEWVRLGDATQYTQYGTSAKSQKQGQVPVLRMGNIQPPAIDWKDLAFTSDDDEITKCHLDPGDVLFNRTNSRELVGKPAFFNGDRNAIFAGYLVRLAQPTGCSGRFMTAFLNSSSGRFQTQKSRADGINQSNVSAGKLVQFYYPLAPADEQTEIVRRVDGLMALCDDLRATTEIHGLRAQRLINTAFATRETA